MQVIGIVLLVWVLNMAICAAINVFNETRIPRSLFDLLKLTFLPYLLGHLEDVKN